MSRNKAVEARNVNIVDGGKVASYIEKRRVQDIYLPQRAPSDTEKKRSQEEKLGSFKPKVPSGHKDFAGTCKINLESMDKGFWILWSTSKSNACPPIRFTVLGSQFTVGGRLLVTSQG